MVRVLLVRNFVTAVAVGALLGVPSTAGAVTLSTPAGMSTTSNTPPLAWQPSDGEVVTEVRVSKAANVGPDGALTSTYVRFEENELSGASSLADWADIGSTPLWPGTYFWQARATTTAPDGVESHVWTAPRKVVVKRLFAPAAGENGLTNLTNSGGSFTTKFRAKTNVKQVPISFAARLNGHPICASKVPLKRVDDMGVLIAETTITCKIKYEYYKLGRNTITTTGTIGSKAITGKVYSLASSDTFEIKPKR